MARAISGLSSRWGPRTLGQRLAAYSIPEPNTGCLFWLGGTNRLGYGRLNINGKVLLAHRASYESAGHHVPADAVVLHSCDTPGCINPDHLRVGTKADNSHDMVLRNRKRGPECPVRGSMVGTSKLTEAQVVLILGDKRLLREIAAVYGVTITTIWYIKKGLFWRHVKAQVKN